MSKRVTVECFFELICPNCHSLTPTFRALNKGKGRNRGRLAESGLLHSS